MPILEAMACGCPVIASNNSSLPEVIGEGNAVFARFAISSDGRQVLRTKAKKVVSKTVTATINPDGTGQSGVPADRTDMRAIEARLEQPLELEYFPYRRTRH
jgi:glycosyltransferase involved in cell wall biosynthesis